MHLLCGQNIKIMHNKVREVAVRQWRQWRQWAVVAYLRTLWDVLMHPLRPSWVPPPVQKSGRAVYDDGSKFREICARDSYLLFQAQQRRDH